MNVMHSPRRQPPSSPRSAPARVIDTTALRRQFDEFDKNGSGFIERNECIAALAKLGSKLKDLDMDGDSRISFEEVRHFAWHTSRFAMHRQPPFPCISHAAHDAANLPCACLRCRVRLRAISSPWSPSSPAPTISQSSSRHGRTLAYPALVSPPLRAMRTCMRLS